MDMTHQSTTPSRYMMPASQDMVTPLPKSRCTPKNAVGTGDSSASGGVKRKRDAHFLDNVATPETPYGGPEASKVSRKVWKKVYDDMGKHQWGEEEWEEHRARQKRAQEFADERNKRADDKQKEFASMLGQGMSAESQKEVDDRVMAATVARLE